MNYETIQKRLQKESNPAHAESYRRFFKKDSILHDQFIGVRVPTLRKIAKELRTLPLEEIKKLLSSEVHEERLLALYLLVYQIDKKSDLIYRFYLDNKRFVNHWDLVDTSAHKIVGVYLEDRDRGILRELALSPSIWDRRIALIATWHFIKKKDFKDTLEIAALLLGDKEDLIHKATGWMLREVGKQDKGVLESFLKKHLHSIPKTALRYALEKTTTRL